MGHDLSGKTKWGQSSTRLAVLKLWSEGSGQTAFYSSFLSAQCSLKTFSLLRNLVTVMAATLIRRKSTFPQGPNFSAIGGHSTKKALPQLSNHSYSEPLRRFFTARLSHPTICAFALAPWGDGQVRVAIHVTMSAHSLGHSPALFGRKLIGAPFSGSTGL